MDYVRCSIVSVFIQVKKNLVRLSTGTEKSTPVSKICNVHYKVCQVINVANYWHRLNFNVPVQSRGWLFFSYHYSTFVGTLDRWTTIQPSWEKKNIFLSKQANSENCGPPRGNKFDLEKGRRSRSQNGANWKGLSQGTCMPNINALSLILQKIWARLKFLWQTDGGTDGQTEGQKDGRMSFNVPR